MNQPTDPYQPPSTSTGWREEPRTAPRDVESADRWRRLGTYMIDYFCFLVLAVVAGVILGVAFGEIALRWLQGFGQYLFSFTLLFAYYTFFEGLWARTPGKWACGTVVIDDNSGRPPSFGQVLTRTVARFIPFEPFSMFTQDRRGWHDSLAHTRVVLVSDLR